MKQCLPYRKLLIFYLVIFILVISHALRAETDIHNEIKSRATADNALTKEEIELLSKAFDVSENYIKEKYGVKIGEALNKIAGDNSDETEIGAVLATLFGTLNTNQIKAIGSLVPRYFCFSAKDERLIELKKRLSWAQGYFIPPDGPIPSCPNERRSGFLESFRPAFKSIEESNAEFYRLLKDSLNGNEPAKKDLRDKYDNKVMLSFIDAQMKSGNTTLAKEIAEALSFNNDGKGFVIDAIDSEKKNVRIHIGKNSDEIEKSLTQFVSLNIGFREMHLSPKEHTAIDRDIKPVFKKKVNEKKIEPTKPLPKIPTSIDAPIEALFKANCVKCHGPGGKASDSFLMNIDGTLPTKNSESANSIINRVYEEKDMPMGPNSFTDTDRELVKKWAEGFK